MQLVINAGSSSLKWALYPSLEAEQARLQGSFDGFGEDCTFSFGGRAETVQVEDHAAAVKFLLSFLLENGVARKRAVSSCVHRVVHGGEKYHAPTLIDEEVMEDIESLSLLAPLHNPANLAGIRACREALPDAEQVAVFDTAFHHTIPKHAFLYAVPYELYEEYRIRKYGFHGINHEYIASVLEEEYGGHVDAISCHLGSGSSITALRHGQSVETTMGFTPLDGVMMATRTGELDPEIPLFLIREGHYSVEEIEELFNDKSGLLGITGHEDLREVWRLAKEGDERCRLALDMLSYRVAYYVNALRTAVPAPQALVFTAGIGEGAWYVRKQVCDYLQLSLDEERNRAHDYRISAPDSPADVFVIPANEQLHMHRRSRDVLS